MRLAMVRASRAIIVAAILLALFTFSTAFVSAADYSTITLPVTFTVKGAPTPTPGGGGGGGGGWLPGTPTPTPKPGVSPTPTGCSPLGGPCAGSADCCNPEASCLNYVCALPSPTPAPFPDVPVDLQVPGVARVNSTIDAIVTDANGSPLPWLIVRVITPSHELLEFTADAWGGFRFVPTEVGVYVYYVPGRVMVRARSTNVVAPGTTPPPTPSPTPTPPIARLLVTLASPDLPFLAISLLAFIVIATAIRAYIYSKGVD